MSPEEAYRYYGAVVWVRFLALGVASPSASTLAFFHEYSPQQDGLGELLTEATKFSFRREQVAPNAKSCEAFFLNNQGVYIVRECASSARIAVILRLFDGLSEDDVCRLTGVSVAKMGNEIAAIHDQLADVAEPLPADSMVADHIDSVLFAGLMLDTLAPLITRQAERHIAECGLCMRRLEVWTSRFDAFKQLPVPAPPKSPSLVIPILGVVLAFTLSAALVVMVVLALITQQAAVEPEAYHTQVATIELRNAEGVLAKSESVRPGEIVSLRYDPYNAPYVGFARRQGDRVEVLLSAKSKVNRGLVQAPVDIIVGESEKQSVYVVLSETPLSNADILSAVEKGASEGRTIAVRALSVVR